MRIFISNAYAKFLRAFIMIILEMIRDVVHSPVLYILEALSKAAIAELDLGAAARRMTAWLKFDGSLR